MLVASEGPTVTIVFNAQVSAAQAVHLPPTRSLVALYAGLLRDVGAVQVSTARWILDA